MKSTSERIQELIDLIKKEMKSNKSQEFEVLNLSFEELELVENHLKSIGYKVLVYRELKILRIALWRP